MTGHLVIDDAGHGIPDGRGIAVRADRAVHGLPDIPLIARPPFGAEHQFPMDILLSDGEEVIEVVPTVGVRCRAWL